MYLTISQLRSLKLKEVFTHISLTFRRFRIMRHIPGRQPPHELGYAFDIITTTREYQTRWR